MLLSPISIILSTLCWFSHGKIYERCELARELRNFDLPNEEIPTWVCIAQHESNFDTTAMNPGSGDHGIFQISQLYWCSPPGDGFGCNTPCSKFRDDDIADDLQCIRRIHNEHTRISGDGFDAWVVYPLYCKGDTSRYMEGCIDGQPQVPIIGNATENEIPSGEPFVDEYGDGYQFPPLPSFNKKNEEESSEYEFLTLPITTPSPIIYSTLKTFTISNKLNLVQSEPTTLSYFDDLEFSLTSTKSSYEFSHKEEFTNEPELEHNYNTTTSKLATTITFKPFVSTSIKPFSQSTTKEPFTTVIRPDLSDQKTTLKPFPKLTFAVTAKPYAPVFKKVSKTDNKFSTKDADYSFSSAASTLKPLTVTIKSFPITYPPFYTSSKLPTKQTNYFSSSVASVLKSFNSSSLKPSFVTFEPFSHKSTTKQIIATSRPRIRNSSTTLNPFTTKLKHSTKINAPFKYTLKPFEHATTILTTKKPFAFERFITTNKPFVGKSLLPFNPVSKIALTPFLTTPKPIFKMTLSPLGRQVTFPASAFIHTLPPVLPRPTSRRPLGDRQSTSRPHVGPFGQRPSKKPSRLSTFSGHRPLRPLRPFSALPVERLSQEDSTKSVRNEDKKAKAFNFKQFYTKENSISVYHRIKESTTKLPSSGVSFVGRSFGSNMNKGLGVEVMLEDNYVFYRTKTGFSLFRKV